MKIAWTTGRVPLLLLCVLGVLCPPAGSAPDGRRLALQERQGPALRWDELDRTPYLLDGREHTRRRDGERGFELPPGGAITVLLPAHRVLRLELAAGSPAPRIETAQTAGLWMVWNPVRAQDHTWLIAPDFSAAGRIRIIHAAQANASIRFRAFVSRRVPAVAAADYPQRLALDAEPRRLRRDGTLRPRAVWPVAAEHPVETDVEGPARLRIRAFVRYPNGPEDPLGLHRIRVLLDENPVGHWEPHSGAPGRTTWHLDGEAVSVSLPEELFLEIPQGTHRLRIESSHAALVAVDRSGGTADFLLPGLNAPRGLDRCYAETDVPSPLAFPLTEWCADLRATATPELSIHAARALAADTRFRNSGELAVQALVNAARSRPSAAALQKAADRAAVRASYWSDLYPDTDVASRFEHYLDIQVSMPGVATDLDYTLHTPFLAMTRDKLPRALFSPLPPGGVLEYRLPAGEDPETTSLRLIVTPEDRSRETRLRIITDDAPPRWIRVTPADTLAPAHPRPDRAAAVHRWLAEHAPQSISPPVPAARYDFAIPSHGGRVRILSEAGSAPVRVALQRRRSRPARLTEDAYLGLIRELGGIDTVRVLFGLAVRRAGEILDPDRHGAIDEIIAGARIAPSNRTAARRLILDWIPLLRHLHRLRVVWSRNVTAPQDRQSTAAPGEPFPPVPNDDSLHALLHWRSVLERSPWKSAQAVEAAVGLSQALRRLGETHLAELWLRRLVLYGPDPETRRRAYRRLRDEYRRAGNEVALDGLLATALDRADGEVLAHTVQRWLEAGRFRPALQLAALLNDPSAVETERLAAAALNAGWPQQMQRALAHMAPRRAVRWRVRAWAAAGRFSEARALAAEQGLDEVAALLSEPDSRACPESTPELLAVRRARWHAALPGPRRWRDVTAQVASPGPWRKLHSRSRDLDAATRLVARGRPILLRVAGPVRLRIELRPLHEREDTPMSGWVRVRDATGAVWVYPIDDNLASDDLDPLPEGHPGRRVHMDLELGAGVHRLRLEPGVDAALVRVLAWLPEGVQGLLAFKAVDPPRQPVFPSLSCARDGTEITCRYPNDDEANPFHPAALASQCLAPPPARAASAETPTAWRPMVRVDTARSEPASSVAARLVRLRWRLHRKALSAPAALAAVARMKAEAAADPRVSTLARPVLRHGAWAPLEPVSSSAGLEVVELPPWAATTPSLRSRWLLLDARCRGHARLLTRDGALAYALRLPRRETITLRLTACPVEPTRPATQRVALEIDGAYGTEFTLPPDSGSTTVDLDLPAGDTTMVLRLEDPYPNRYVGISVEAPWLSPNDRTIRRTFYLATRDEPVEAVIRGPAWVRIDRWTGSLSSTYRWIGPGDHTLRLLPPGGERAGYRLFVLRWRQKPRSAPLEPRHVPEPVPALALGPPPTPHAPALPLDGLALGGQEGGTPGLALSLVDRLEPDESEGASAGHERFLQLLADYRHREMERDRDRIWRVGFLGRLREFGGPTLGLFGRVQWRPLFALSDLHTSLRLSVYLQNPGTRRDGRAGAWEASVTLRAAARLRHRLSARTLHLPKLELFGRWLTLDESDVPYFRRDLDRDVYTRYKAEHRYGWILSDTLRHRPWMDTLLEAGAKLVSNESLSLDHAELRLRGWQRLGAFSLGLGYRWRHYLDDEDRARGFSDNRLQLALAGEHWSRSRQRWYWELRADHDLERGETGFRLVLGWNGGNGRGLEDWFPGEHPFSTLSAAAMPEDPNRIRP